MAANLRFAAEAEFDIDAAFAWYESQQLGLGEEFLRCLDAKLQSVCRSPDVNEFAYRSFRRALLRRFPYQIFYEFEGDTVTVYCIFHAARDPNKWKQHLKRV